MTSLKLVGAALMLSTAFATPVFAQSAAGLPELPGDYAFFSPSDDFSPAASGRSACTGCCPRSEAADAPAQGPPVSPRRALFLQQEIGARWRGRLILACQRYEAPAIMFGSLLVDGIVGCNWQCAERPVASRVQDLLCFRQGVAWQHGSERQACATASLDDPLRAARLHAQAGTKERPPGTNKGTAMK